jgi:hypothetical protein
MNFKSFNGTQFIIFLIIEVSGVENLMTILFLKAKIDFIENKYVLLSVRQLKLL